MKGQKIDIADDPETKRHLQNTQVISQVQYHGDHERKKMQEENRPKEELVKNTSSSSKLFPIRKCTKLFVLILPVLAEVVQIQNVFFPSDFNLFGIFNTFFI